MSNNAIYGGSPYHVIAVEGHEVELEPVGEGGSWPFWVDVMAATLIIDPTDDQWAAARRRTQHQVVLNLLANETSPHQPGRSSGEIQERPR